MTATVLHTSREPGEETLARGDFSEHGSHPSVLFVLPSGDHCFARRELTHEILEPESVPLLERGALALSVVGQNDEVVRAWSFRHELFEGAENTVDTPKRCQ